MEWLKSEESEEDWFSWLVSSIHLVKRFYHSRWCVPATDPNSGRSRARQEVMDETFATSLLASSSSSMAPHLEPLNTGLLPGNFLDVVGVPRYNAFRDVSGARDDGKNDSLDANLAFLRASQFPWDSTFEQRQQVNDSTRISASPVFSPPRDGITESQLPLLEDGFASYVSQTAPGSCRCASSAILLLEALEVEDHHLSLLTVDHVLRINKQGLAKCSRVLECRSCARESSLLMLIVFICRKMVTSYERVIGILTQQYEKLQQLKSKAGPRSLAPEDFDTMAEDRDGRPEGEFQTMGVTSLRNHEVDAAEEPCVFAGLATFQMHALGKLLARISIVASKSGWETQCVMLTKIENRMQEQVAAIKAYEERVHALGP